MKTNKRIDKEPIYFNRQIKRRFKPTKVQTNVDFTKYFVALNAYFFAHNFYGLTPCIMSDTRNYLCCTNEGNGIMKECNNYILIEDVNLCRVIFIPSSSGFIELYKIEVLNKGRGLGSILINAFNGVGRQTGIKIKLIPGDPTNGDFAGSFYDKKRRAFYHRLGFKRSQKSEYWTN